MNTLQWAFWSVFMCMWMICMLAPTKNLVKYTLACAFSGLALGVSISGLLL